MAALCGPADARLTPSPDPYGPRTARAGSTRQPHPATPAISRCRCSCAEQDFRVNGGRIHSAINPEFVMTSRLGHLLCLALPVTMAAAAAVARSAGRTAAVACAVNLTNVSGRGILRPIGSTGFPPAAALSTTYAIVVQWAPSEGHGAACGGNRDNLPSVAVVYLARDAG